MAGPSGDVRQQQPGARLGGAGCGHRPAPERDRRRQQHDAALFRPVPVATVATAAPLARPLAVREPLADPFCEPLAESVALGQSVAESLTVDVAQPFAVNLAQQLAEQCA